MNILNEAVLTISSPRTAAALSEAAGKSFLILAAAFPLALLCRRSAAVTRHFLWLGVLASLLALPVATVLAPRWSGPAWTGPLLHERPAQFADNAVPALVTVLKAASPDGKSAAATPLSTSPHPAAPVAKHFPWRALIWPGWLTGVVLTLLVFLEQRRRLRRIERAARPVTNPEVLALRDSILRELRLRRKVRLSEIEQPLMPMTWGCWRAAALLPADAVKWERERLRLVLRHELAHVRRGDCLTQALAAIVCALYWFNPLAWLAAARMRVERERACDDLVVALGQTRPSEYAGHLLDIARQLSAAPHAALPVAKRSGLEQRLQALLDGGNHHGEMTGRPAVAVVCALAAGLVVLAGWRVAAADMAPETLRKQLIARLQVRGEPSDADLRKLQETLAGNSGYAGQLRCVPISQVRSILEQRLEIKDCVYWSFPMKGMLVDVSKRQSASAVLKGTSSPQYYRCMYGSNGYYSMYNDNYSIATNMVHYWQSMHGRYGRIHWRGMGYGFATNFASINRSDGVTPCDLFFPDDPGAMSTVTVPLTLGVVPLAYGSIHFLDKTRFVGGCWLTNGTVSGRLITTDGETTSGIAYRVSFPLLANRKFLVTFLAPDDGVVNPDKEEASDVPFPVHEWANYSIGTDQSNWLGKTCISYIQLSTNLLTEAYFNPLSSGLDEGDRL